MMYFRTVSYVLALLSATSPHQKAWLHMLGVMIARRCSGESDFTLAKQGMKKPDEVGWIHLMICYCNYVDLLCLSPSQSCQFSKS